MNLPNEVIRYLIELAFLLGGYYVTIKKDVDSLTEQLKSLNSFHLKAIETGATQVQQITQNTSDIEVLFDRADTRDEAIRDLEVAVASLKGSRNANS